MDDFKIGAWIGFMGITLFCSIASSTKTITSNAFYYFMGVFAGGLVFMVSIL